MLGYLTNKLIYKCLDGGATNDRGNLPPVRAGVPAAAKWRWDSVREPARRLHALRLPLGRADHTDKAERIPRNEPHGTQ